MGLGTINSSVRNTESPETYNVEPYKLSGLKSQEGNKQIGQTLSAEVSLGHEYRKGSYKYLIVCTIDGKVWEFDRPTDSFVEIYQFPTATHRHSAVNFNQGVVISNGIDDLIYYNHGRNTRLNGLVSITDGSNTVQGVGTSFTKEVAVGDIVTIDSESYEITEITSDTVMEVSPVVSIEGGGTLTDLPYYLSPLSKLNAVYINSDDATVNYPIRGLALNAYKGRLWVGANDGNLYYSEVGLIHGWDVKYGAGAIPPFYNDSSNFSPLGIYADYLIVHKQDYSYYISDTTDQGDFVVTPYTDHSCDSQQSWISCNNSYFIYSRKNGGIYPFMARTAFINHYLGQEISVKIRDDFRLLDDARSNEIFPVYHPIKKYLMFYMPMLQGKGSNICYIYDFISKAWWLRKVPQEVTCAFAFNSDVYIGTANGEILREFSTLTFNGEPIEFCWKSPWFQYGDGTSFLSTREFRCKISEEYANNFYVRNRRDGYDAFHQRNVNNDKDAFEALVWSNDAGDITETVWDDYDWVEVGYLIRRFPIPDQFFTSQQIEFYGNVANEAMCLLGFELDRVEKEDASW